VHRDTVSCVRRRLLNLEFPSLRTREAIIPLLSKSRSWSQRPTTLPAAQASHNLMRKGIRHRSISLQTQDRIAGTRIGPSASSSCHMPKIMALFSSAPRGQASFGHRLFPLAVWSRAYHRQWQRENGSFPWRSEYVRSPARKHNESSKYEDACTVFTIQALSGNLQQGFQYY
jgi:hypothetical protein